MASQTQFNVTEETMLTLLNCLFESSLKPKGLKSLTELTNEKLLRKLIIEIEPNIEANNNKIEITDDMSFGIRYANIVGIITAVENYKNRSSEKDRFTLNTNFKNLIIVNGLLKNDKDQLLLLSELLLFLSAISSKKDYYLDRLSEIDEMKIYNVFFQVIEKYLVIEKNDDTINQSHLERSYVFSTQLNKVKEDYEKQIASLIQIIKDNESKVLSLQSKNETLEKNLNETELRLKDKERELEMIKNTQNQNFKYQEQLFKDSITNSELTNQLHQKEIEINELKNQYSLEKKKFDEEVLGYKDKIDILEEKLKEIKNVQSKYEKLNNKYKEINMNSNISSKNSFEKTKEFLTKENQNLQMQIEKIMKELLSEKERYFKVEEEKKKLERNIIELKNEIIILNNNQNANNNGNNLMNNMNNISLADSNKEGFELGNDSFFNDLKGKVNEKEFNDMKNERNDLLKMYKSQNEEIAAISKEKEKYQTENETNKMEIERLKREIERLGIEKEKAEIQTQKVELNFQKLKIDFDKKENNKTELDKNYKETLNHNKKEIEQLKNEISNHKTLNEKMLNEKKNLINDYKNLQKEFEKFRNEVNANNATHKNNQKKNNIYSSNKKETSQFEAEILQLKNEIQNLKLQNIQKEELIKSLKNENEEKDKNEDLDFYKKSYEEQKLRVNEEHKLISESLYKLAVHFMSLKDDLQKKINNNTSNK